MKMRAKVEFSREADELIKNLVEDNKSIDYIKDEINKLNIKCSRSSVAKHITEMGLNISKNKSRKSLLDEKELIYNIIDGLSYEEIANKMNIDLDTLKHYIINHNISNKADKEKIRLQTWIGGGTVDLRKIKDNSIDDISKYLNCKLTKNALVEVDGKQFMVDFYSKEYNIVFLCCLNGDKPNRAHSIPDRQQWDWIQKLKEMDPLMKIISYFYLNPQKVADHINEIMKDPYFVDEHYEKNKSHDIYFEELDGPKVKPVLYQPEELKTINNQRRECFQYENVMYDKEGFRLIDFDTLIININPMSGDKLNENKKQNVLEIYKQCKQYDYYLNLSKNVPMYWSEDDWNYDCGRKLYHLIKNQLVNI